MSKLYARTRRLNHLDGDKTQFGFIEDRKVDDFNDPVKVFVPVAEVGTFGLVLANQDWLYISTLRELRLAFRRERAAVANLLRDTAQERTEETKYIIDMLEKIS